MGWKALLAAAHAAAHCSKFTPPSPLSPRQPRWPQDMGFGWREGTQGRRAIRTCLHELLQAPKGGGWEGQGAAGGWSSGLLPWLTSLSENPPTAPSVEGCSMAALFPAPHLDHHRLVLLPILLLARAHPHKLHDARQVQGSAGRRQRRAPPARSC